MLHQLLLASYSQPEAAGFILRSIHFIFLTVGGVIAAIISGFERPARTNSVRFIVYGRIERTAGGL